jgi:hypothetical protein
LSKTSGFFAFILAGVGFAAAAQSTHYYVPLVIAVIGEESLPGQQVIRTEWVSSLSAFNTGQALATVQPIAIYGDLSLGQDGGLPYQLLPLTGQSIFRLPWTGFNAPSSPGPLGIAELVADSGVILNAGIEKAQLHCGCSNPDILDCVLVSQGRTAIPVFQGLFPAGATVVCGDVNLGAPEQTCGDPPNQQYIRRVNVTLFNGGSQSATFSITAIPLARTSQPLYQQGVTLAPKEVRQLNRVPIPVVTDTATRSGYDVFAWITISSTQPFLAYVSSIFEGGAPGSMPFEVFPPRLAASSQ